MKWKKFNCAGEFRGCLVDVDVVTALVLSGSAKMQAFDTMGCPSATVFRHLVNQDSGAQWCKWCLVEVKNPSTHQQLSSKLPKAAGPAAALIVTKEILHDGHPPSTKCSILTTT
jgi:hypothetical protein